MKGRLIVIVGPSGSGKTELVRELVKRVPNSIRLVTTTTRARRPGEGDDYFFITKEQFDQGIKDGDFFEYEEFCGNMYGVSKKVFEEYKEKYDYVFAIIEYKGARTLKERVPHTLVLFIKPGSVEEIINRLRKARGNINIPPEELQKRIDIVKHELEAAPTFDGIIENKEGQFEEAVAGVMEKLSK